MLFIHQKMDSEYQGPCLKHCYTNNLFIGILIGIAIIVISNYYMTYSKKK
jgi:hypothetical protein